MLQPYKEPRNPNVNIRNGPPIVKLDWSADLKPGLVWLHKNLCLLVVNSLNGDEIMAASAGEIIQLIVNDTSRNGTVFGVVFSLSHCCILRLEIDEQRSFTLQHTSVLSFIPSARATIRSTPGITALVRLMIHLTEDPIQDCIRALKPATRDGYYDDPLFCEPIRSHLQKLPTEVCEQIAENLGPRDIVNFSHLSPTCRQAASYVLRWPQIQLANNYFTLIGIMNTAELLGDHPHENDETDKPMTEMQKRVLRKRLTCSGFLTSHPVYGSHLMVLGTKQLDSEGAKPLKSGQAWYSFLGKRFRLEMSLYPASEDAMEDFLDFMYLDTI